MTLDARGRIKLYETKQEREELEQHADLFSILKVTEKLERAWTRGLIGAKEYEEQCLTLIAQFKTLWSTLKATVPDVEKFMQQHSMQCPMALQRLVVVGVPATVQHGGAGTSSGPAGGSSTAQVSDTTAAFITCLDSVRLSMLAVDQLQPSLNDLMSALNKMTELPADFEGRKRVLGWLRKLADLRADYELDGIEARQLEHDLNSSYTEWQQTLK
mmetsp:Transcript_14863/g.44902  ORF Transcript_14863/g.44902 Transcript_14863/m.44902 type:complete len:215 (-) Transcript_14863:1649-2293(-)|eukprot:CAMPEP_0206141994 /NCGR_PEP_ID=MMETSP1473-20131121/15075_1 /ASSEMBLY_ACC=CAM_ASM_001109 /TAXON_ID=1461547 /ORGANISM="Stichococcus sp, Strain RCC1054" /LENGTH=214 /DNA_ID=CAMNT_0053536785 /DNA_START=515 /DNA_END=1159 /DNA_ORIENTATION=-